MANPDPRRGDEPGDRNVTSVPPEQPEPRPAPEPQDKPEHELENDDDLRAGQYGPTGAEHDDA